MSLHIGINLCPYTGGNGGAELYLGNLVLALSQIECRHRVSLFIARGMEGHFSASTGFHEIVCGRVGQSRPRRVWLEQTRLPQLVRRHAVDVIFSNYVSPVRARCRQIVTVHDLLYKIHPGYISPRSKLGYWRTMVPVSVRRAETVLTVSRYSADHLRRAFPADAHKVVVGAQAVSRDLASMNSPERDADLIARMGITEPFVLCTAGLDRHKNVAGLLRGFEAAARRHRDLSIVLTDPYGRTSLDGVPELNGHVKDRLILTGCVPPRALAALYRRAAVHVIASHFEGFGRSIIEAQFFGCPTVASLAASMPEVAGDAALYFHPDDAATLGNHLETLLQDDRRRSDLIARGTRNVQRYDWATAARQILDLCERPPRRAERAEQKSRSPRFIRRVIGIATARHAETRNGRIKELPLLILMPHSRCNCRCVMCDIWKDNASRHELSLEQIASWRSTFREFRVRRVMLTGGEPLMHGNVERLIELLHACGLHVTLLSTGLLLSKHASAIVDWCADVVVSLDGSPSVHDAIRRVPGGFERLADGVRQVHTLDPSFPVLGRCTIQQGNFRDWIHIVDAARAMGLKSISFQAADVTTTAFNHPHGWEPSRAQGVAVPRTELDELTETIEKVIRTRAADIQSGFVEESPEKLRRIGDHYAALCGVSDPVAPRCNVPWVSAVVEADGQVRPCFFHRVVGNIHDAPLAEILNADAMVRFRKTLRIEEDPICRRCVCALHLSSPRQLTRGRTARRSGPSRKEQGV